MAFIHHVARYCLKKEAIWHLSSLRMAVIPSSATKNKTKKNNGNKIPFLGDSLQNPEMYTRGHLLVTALCEFAVSGSSWEEITSMISGSGLNPRGALSSHSPVWAKGISMPHLSLSIQHWFIGDHDAYNVNLKYKRFV